MLSRSDQGYRWVILAVSFFQQSLAYTAWYSFTVFLVALVDERGWSRGETAFALSLFIVTQGLASPISGTLLDRYGPRRLVPIGGLTLGVALALCSQVQELWQLYVLFGLLAGVGLSAVGWVVSSTVLTHWFREARATALGVGGAGIGFGILAFVPLTQAIVLSHGWRSAYVVLGLLIGAGLPLLTVLLRMPARPAPGARGTEASRPTLPYDHTVIDREWADTVWSVRRAMRTRRYWYVLASFALATFGTQLVQVHQLAMLVDVNFDPQFSAAVVGVVGITSIAAKPLWGLLSDRIGREPVQSAGMLLVVVSLAFMEAARTSGRFESAIAFGVTLGVGYAVTAALSPAIAADIFQGRHFGAVFGSLGFFHGVGGAAGAWAGGFVRDVSGQYEPGLLLAGAGCLLSGLFCWLAAPRRVRLVQGVARRRARAPL